MKFKIKPISKPIRIGIDGMVMPAQINGVGRYVDNLLNSFKNNKENVEFIIFLGANQKDLIKKYKPYFTVIKSRISTHFSLLNFLRMQLLLPFSIKKNKIDVLHVPNEKLVLFKSCKLIITIHDVADFKISRRTNYFRRIYRKILMPVILRKADHLIAVSRNTENDLKEIFKMSSNKITVIKEGIAPVISNLRYWGKYASNLNKYNIDNEYILFVGELSIRKNLLVLIEAFSSLIKTYDYTMQLVIVGNNGNAKRKIKKKIEAKGLQEKVILTGFVSDQDLAFLYRNAKLFVMPSLYEGFGLPVVEAMASGAPIIASKSGSLPEVVGNAGLLVNCTSVSSLCDSMHDMLKNKDLRTKLIKNGLKRAKMYSWKDTADRTLKLYRTL